MLLVLLTRLLVWAAVGLLIWWVLLKFIPRNFLTWFGGAIILTLIVLSFLEPNDQTVGAIWQIISFPLTPLGGALLLLLIAVSGGIKKVNGRYVVTAISILLISSMPLVSRALVSQAESAVQEAYSSQRDLCTQICPALEDPDAPLGRVVGIVAPAYNVDVQIAPDGLTSRIDAQNDLDPTLVSRLNSTAEVYDRLRGNSPIVFVTAGALNPDSEAGQERQQQIRQRLADRGVPPGNIVIQNSGTDMRATAERVKEYLQERDLYDDPDEVGERLANRVVLVAPALSMRRAALTMENIGLQVVAYPTDIYGLDSPQVGDVLVRLSDLVPNVEALRLTTRYWEELLTSIYYFLRGWLPDFSVRWENVVETVNTPE
ncbi:hypothetical protein C7271_03235 [filamentous cyanobacterium CCP5]|nr:hypothetical protein C7271_03235 [filamentous cyanobacterium CCP5]